MWPETLSGFVINASCPNGPIGEIAVRKCAVNDTWESPNIIRCATTEISNGFKNISIVKYYAIKLMCIFFLIYRLMSL